MRYWLEIGAVALFALLALAFGGSDPAYAQPALVNVSAPINVTVGTTQIVAAPFNTSIHVTAYTLAPDVDTVTFEYGTGTNCGTGTTALSGAMTLTAATPVTAGAGVGTILYVPPGNALCLLTTASQQGHLAYELF